jgi:tRNA A37 threonylcarbamoyladenosine biosynthesis protein TsaE
LAEALGIKEVVNSPTFILMKIYTIPDIRYPKSDKRYPPASLREALRAGAIRDLIHIDAYRLESFDQLKEIGVEEYLNKEDCLVVVEWADRVSALRQYPHYHELNFQEGKNYNSRVLGTHIWRIH